MWGRGKGREGVVAERVYAWIRTQNPTVRNVSDQLTRTAAAAARGHLFSSVGVAPPLYVPSPQLGCLSSHCQGRRFGMPAEGTVRATCPSPQYQRGIRPSDTPGSSIATTNALKITVSRSQQEKRKFYQWCEYRNTSCHDHIASLPAIIDRSPMLHRKSHTSKALDVGLQWVRQCSLFHRRSKRGYP